MVADPSSPEAERLRLFFALWPSGPLRAAIRRATRDVVRHAGGRPIPPASYHLTLAFLGERRRALVPALMDAAATLPPVAGLLTLSRIGWFERARVLWFGPGHTPPPLARHTYALKSTLAELGVEIEARPFHAHLTLARKVSRAPATTDVRQVSWFYSGFALVASEPTPRGSRYRVLARWPSVPLEASEA